jgi:DNA-binding response OmpR family regulator
MRATHDDEVIPPGGVPMSERAVLFAGTSERLRRAIERMGLTVVSRPTLTGAVSALCRRRFLAIIFVRTGADADALEFVFNVRDVTETTPIVVVNGRETARDLEAFLGQRNTFVLAGPVRPTDVAAKVEQIIRSEGEGNVYERRN